MPEVKIEKGNINGNEFPIVDIKYENGGHERIGLPNTYNQEMIDAWIKDKLGSIPVSTSPIIDLPRSAIKPFKKNKEEMNYGNANKHSDTSFS